MILAFDAKTVELIDDPVRGYTALCPEGKELLNFIAALCRSNGWPRPLVTCFGRTKDDQEDCYVHTYLQDLHNQGVVGQEALQKAKELARARWSNHCIVKSTRQFSAFDLRDRIYGSLTRSAIIESVLKQYGNKVEALDHAVPGGAQHFHFGWKRTKPLDPNDWI